MNLPFLNRPALAGLTVVSLLHVAFSAGADPGKPAAATTAAVPARVTFTEHVAPILFQNCARCHRPGEAGPFPLLTYEDARKRGRQIVEVTARRDMPPWHAESGHVAFSNERRLTDGQMATLAAWHRQGMPEGDRAKLPALPRFPEGWQLGKPDLVLKLDRAFPVPAEGPDIYWNFVFPLNLPEGRHVKAIEFRPGARRVVHHALYYLDTNGVARGYDERDPKPGYNGGKRGTQQFQWLGGWAVGGEALMLPPELAWSFPTNSDLVLQTHYHPSGKPEEDDSMVGVWFSEQPPTRRFTMVQVPPLFGRLNALDIPAGQSNYVVRDSFVLPVDVEAFVVTPHAHNLAKSFHLTATAPDGPARTLLKVPDWDFNWQEDCAFAKPLRLAKGTRLEATVTYDNSEANPNNPTRPPRRVKWGPQTTDEMASITLGVMPVRDADLAELEKAKELHVADLFIDRAQEDKRRREQVQMVVATFDKNGNGKIDEEERPPLRAFIQQSGFLRGF
jgi:mono/diheme cytochrome c family protein